MPTTKSSVRPRHIGVTGTIASGKSLVGRLLQEAGVPVLDTDAVVHQLYAEDAELKHALVAAFGPDVLSKDAVVDRGWLKARVFGDPKQKETLEQLVHPRVKAAVRAFHQAQEESPITATLVPLLFEANSASLYDSIWCVTCDEPVLLARLMARNHVDLPVAKALLAKQWSQSEKAARADRVIDNSGAPEETRAQVQQALRDESEAGHG
jgi:dephospho-CoA kinase